MLSIRADITFFLQELLPKNKVLKVTVIDKAVNWESCPVYALAPLQDHLTTTPLPLSIAKVN